MLKKIFDKVHILQNIYLKNKKFIKKKSYSMDGEDLEIIKYFKNLNNGFYVDVGCYHPIEMNNTYLLYKKNWTGINIDVSKFSIDLFILDVRTTVSDNGLLSSIFLTCSFLDILSFLPTDLFLIC